MYMYGVHVHGSTCTYMLFLPWSGGYEFINAM